MTSTTTGTCTISPNGICSTCAFCTCGSASAVPNVGGTSPACNPPSGTGTCPQNGTITPNPSPGTCPSSAPQTCTSVLFGLVSTGCGNVVSTSCVDNALAICITKNVMLSESTSISSYVGNTNTFNLTIGPGGSFNCNNFTVSQTITGTVQFITNISSQQAASLVTEIMAQLDSEVSSSANQASGLFSFLSQALNTNSQADIHNQIQSALNESINLSTVNSIINQTANANTLNISIIGGALRGENCTFNQDIAVNVAASNVVNAIQQAFSNTHVGIAIKNQAVSSATGCTGASCSGTSDVTPLVIAAAVIGGLLVLGLIFFFVYRSRRASKAAPPPPSTTTASTTTTAASTSPRAYYYYY